MLQKQDRISTVGRVGHEVAAITPIGAIRTQIVHGARALTGRRSSMQFSQDISAPGLLFYVEQDANGNHIAIPVDAQGLSLALSPTEFGGRIHNNSLLKSARKAKPNAEGVRISGKRAAANAKLKGGSAFFSRTSRLAAQANLQKKAGHGILRGAKKFIRRNPAGASGASAVLGAGAVGAIGGALYRRLKSKQTKLSFDEIKNPEKNVLLADAISRSK